MFNGIITVWDEATLKKRDFIKVKETTGCYAPVLIEYKKTWA